MKYNENGTRTASFESPVEIEKKASDSETGRLALGAKGYPGLNMIQDAIFEESRKDLRWPQAGKTFKKMAADPTVASPINFIDMMIGRIEWKFEAPEDASDESKRAAEFLNWSMHNMEGQTWKDFINEVGSYRIYGFHIAEKVYTQVTSGPWTGKLKWKELSTRSQDTIDGWRFSDDGRKLTHVKQNLSRIASHRGLFLNKMPSETIEIPRNKFLLFRYDPKRNNPEGRSPLTAAYIPWQYKRFIEEYESVGVSRDLGGTPVVGIDVTYLAKAAANPSGPEAQVVDQMKKDAANLHAGEQMYVIVPLAYDDKGKELFSFKLQGIEGGGKNYNTDDIIRRKQNEILTVFMADVLKLGQDGSGSFALSDNKNSHLAMAIEYHLSITEDQINQDLIPQTLALNGWKLREEDMPKLVHGDVDERNLDDLGKFIQRCVSVGAMTTDKRLDEELRTVGKLPVNDYSPGSEIPEAFKPAKSQTRAGDGMKTAGEGTSDGVSDDSSVGNLDNA